MTRDSQLPPAIPSLSCPVTRSADPVKRGAEKRPAQPRANATSAASTDDHSLNADLRDHLGAQLRAMFQEIVTEPLPGRFQRLLDELAQNGPPADEQS